MTRGPFEDRYGGLDRLATQRPELVGAVELVESGSGAAREQRGHNGFVAFGRHLIGGVHTPILPRRNRRSGPDRLRNDGPVAADVKK